MADFPVDATGGDKDLCQARFIGRGGYGEVYEILNNVTRKRFARKLLRPSYKLSTIEILNEANVADVFGRAGGHVNLMEMLKHGWFPDQTYYFIDMTLCAFDLHKFIQAAYGKSSVEKLTSNTYETIALTQAIEEIRNPLINGSLGSLNFSGIINVMRQITAGIDFIHSHNAIHRDLKPINVLFCDYDKMWKIGDFGFTEEFISHSAKVSMDARGTNHYRAPELLSAPATITRKTDVWCLGCIFYELVTGNLAFLHGLSSIKEYSESGGPIELPVLPFQKAECIFLADTIHDLLAIIPTKRPSAAVLAHVLEMCPSPSDIKSLDWVTEEDERLVAVKEIGSGEMGEIFMIKDFYRCKVFARKVVWMFKMSRKDGEQYTANYRQIFDTLYVKNSSKYLVHILELKFLRGGMNFSVDMELCSINLREFIWKGPSPHFVGEMNIWAILLHIANAIEFIHGCNIIHGDVKPILYSDFHKVWQITDVDRAQEGFSFHMTSGRAHSGPFRFMPVYDAPEVIKQDGVNQKVDVWSMGLILYELIRDSDQGFRYLFNSPNQVLDYDSNEKYRNIKRAEFHLDVYLETIRDWRRDDIRETISRTISVSPDDRPFATTLKGVFNELLSAGAHPYPDRSEWRRLEVPEVPEAPEEPEEPKVLNAPKVPEMPEVLDVPEVPEVNKVNGVLRYWRSLTKSIKARPASKCPK